MQKDLSSISTTLIGQYGRNGVGMRENFLDRFIGEIYNYNGLKSFLFITD
jgi:hypothetical protein